MHLITAASHGRKRTTGLWLRMGAPHWWWQDPALL